MSRNLGSLGVPQQPPHHRPRQPSLIPNLDESQVEIVKQGWLNKQGGAKGGRKSWKRRWFVLKEDCLYYKESPESLVLLGVMPLHGCHILDLGCLTQSPPPAHNETQTVCHECKKAFTFLERKHHCRHCGNTFCSTDSTKRIAIPKFGFHSRVRVCDACYEIVAAELESSEVVLKLLELTGEKPDAAQDPSSPLPQQQPYKPAIAAHAQAMEALKHRAALEKANATAAAATAGGGEKRSSILSRGQQAGDEKKRFTLPTVNKPHLFALKNSERELWLHAENTETRLEWVLAIRGIQKRKIAAHSRGLTNGGDGGENGSDASSVDGATTTGRSKKSDAPSWEIDYSCLSVLNKVGVGAFGEVFRARLWGTEVAMKTLKTEQFKDSAALLEDLKKEVSILSQLRHPNVVLYIGACTFPPNVCILTEWCSRGSLYDLLHDYSIPISAKLCIDLAMGISQGMNYLHSLPSRIIHRDLKSHNILVNKSFAVKVADFGLSHVRELQAKGSASAAMEQADGTVIHKGPRHYGIFGTPEWMAPEVMEGNVYTEKIDVYSFGILLSELVTRQMPFHDQAKITNYMDVVDLVLDQGAMPTIPKWCENLLGGLIRQCLNRIPSERPNFTDLILKLREVADLDDSIYFFAFDLPRLRELMMSSNPGIQSLAASELSALLQQSHIRRRSSPADVNVGSPSMAGSPGPSSSPASASVYSATSTPNPTLAPPPSSHTLGMPHLSLPSPSPLPPLAPSPSTAHALNLGGLSSPLITGPATNLTAGTIVGSGSGVGGNNNSRQAHIERDGYWILSNEDAFDFLERFTTLLSSSHREVQLHSCHALRSLLQLSAHDPFKRAQDRELVITNGGLGSLLTLLLSSSILATAAGEVLLLLTEGLTESEQSALIGLNSAGLLSLSELVRIDIVQDELQLQNIQSRIDRKKAMLSVVSQCAASSAASTSNSSGGSGSSTSKSGQSSSNKKPRQTGRRSMTPLKFIPSPGAAGVAGGITASAISEHGSESAQEDDLGEGGEEDESDQISAALLAQAATMAHGLGSPTTGTEPWEGGGGRGRAETAMPRESVAGGNPATNAANPASPVLLDLFVKLNELLSRSIPPPEKFTDWYSNIVRAEYTLRYDLEGDTWSICYVVLLPDELRLFHDQRDEPDEALSIIRTRIPDPESDCGAVIPAKVRLGNKHGMPFCFQVEDCGRIWTFCSGTQEQQERWKQAIVGEGEYAPAGGAGGMGGGFGGSNQTASQAQAGATALPGFSVSVTSPAGNEVAHMAHSPAATGGGAHHPEDPTLGKDIPHLELPTPPFAKRFREITFHGYLFIRDRNTQAWLLKYVLLVGTTLRVFDSHRASPNDPLAEHEIDPEYTNINASERRVTKPGLNEFFIRLHSSSVQFDCWADSSEEKSKWLQALCGDSFSSGSGIPSAMSSAGSSSGAGGNIGPSRIAAFAAYYGHVDYYGFLYRKRKLTNRWMREFVCLVDSEVHYYTSASDPVDQPAGTFYIATNSGKAFHVKQSSKRPHCIGVVNPSRTHYLAAETEKEYLCWVNSFHQNIRRLAERYKMQRSARASVSHVR